MSAVEEIQKKRFIFLLELYKSIDGNRQDFYNMYLLGDELGFDHDLTINIVQYLIDEGLIEARYLGGDIGITHQGVRKVENYDRIGITQQGIFKIKEALSTPGIPSHPFPAIYNFITFGNMVDSVIQLAGHGSTQTAIINEERSNELKEILQSLTDVIEQLNLDQNEGNELKADINTIEAQLSSPRPKRSIIMGGLNSIRRIGETAIGSMIASSDLRTELGSILTKISSLLTDLM